MTLRQVLQMLARRQFHLELLRKQNAPKPLLDMAENNVKRAEEKLWKLMEAGVDQNGEELPPIFDILGREALFARCKALAEEVLVPFIGLHLLIREALDKALVRAGVQESESVLPFDEEDELFERHAPELYYIMTEAYAVRAAVAEKLFLQKWVEVKQALQL